MNVILIQTLLRSILVAQDEIHPGIGHCEGDH
jgi:hypothetical protein